MLKRLNNPTTGRYNDLKNLVLGNEFPWYMESNPRDSFNFYSHVFLERPEAKLYPRVTSPHIDLFTEVLEEIFDYNNVSVNCILRMNANAIEPQKLEQQTVWHNDHEFFHTNILIYLTDAGGDTLVETDEHSPLEDDIIIFRGSHCHKLPTRKRRVVLVATYI
jgi:hypothetical protein